MQVSYRICLRGSTSRSVAMDSIAQRAHLERIELLGEAPFVACAAGGGIVGRQQFRPIVASCARASSSDHQCHATEHTSFAPGVRAWRTRQASVVPQLGELIKVEAGLVAREVGKVQVPLVLEPQRELGVAVVVVGALRDGRDGALVGRRVGLVQQLARLLEQLLALLVLAATAVSIVMVVVLLLLLAAASAVIVVLVSRALLLVALVSRALLLVLLVTLVLAMPTVRLGSR